MGKLFSDDGKLRDPLGLRSVNLGTSRKPRVVFADDEKIVTEILSDEDGSYVGTSTRHASGRIDASVSVRPPSLMQKEGNL